MLHRNSGRVAPVDSGGGSMILMHLLVLAVVQGVTEFLPIQLIRTFDPGASAHRLAGPGHDRRGGPCRLVGGGDGLLLAAAGAYGTGVMAALRGRGSGGLRLLLQTVLATLPVVAAGFVVARFGGDLLRGVEVVAWATLVSASFFGWLTGRQ